MTAVAQRRRAGLEQARLYLVCGPRPESFLTAVLAAGVDVVQLRDKEGSDDEVLDAARTFRRCCDATGALFIVNDRPDLAVAAEADGVHVGQDDMPMDEARSIVGPERILGRSTHSSDQLRAAVGADYVAVGPVYATPTKPGRPAVGLELVRAAARDAEAPFFAIGGINPSNVAAVAAAGAPRVAVVRAIADAPDPGAAARALRAAMVARPEAPVGAA